LFNLGNHSPVSVNQLVTIIEKITWKKFIKEYLPMQAGEVEYTYADISETERKLWRNPKIPLEEGLKKFVDWYNGSF
jgi:UDP-glucuronate 4-epimerase